VEGGTKILFKSNQNRHQGGDLRGEINCSNITKSIGAFQRGGKAPRLFGARFSAGPSGGMFFPVWHLGWKKTNQDGKGGVVGSGPGRGQGFQSGSVGQTSLIAQE